MLKERPDKINAPANTSRKNREYENVTAIHPATEELATEKGGVIIEMDGMSIARQKEVCRNYLSGVVGDLPKYDKNELPPIGAARVMITDKCPYSCVYCGVYYQKLLEAGKISREQFEKRDVGGNEGGSVRSFTETQKNYLDPNDYKFLSAILSYYFGTRDITLTGGDPFARVETKEIIDNMVSIGTKVSALTKGMPLFSENGTETITKQAGRISRIIFSLDTLDSEKYIKLNLPLAEKEVAKKALSKTLDTIKTACELGYHVDVNSIVPPVNLEDYERSEKSFSDSLDIIRFVISTNVKKLKFLELESRGTIGKPYIEKYFLEMRRRGYFNDLGVVYWENPVLNTEQTATKFCLLRKQNGGFLELNTHRAHCSSSALNQDRPKRCELNGTGELNINSTGEIIICQKKPLATDFNLRPLIVARDVKGIVELIKRASVKSREQECPK